MAASFIVVAFGTPISFAEESLEKTISVSKNKITQFNWDKKSIRVVKSASQDSKESYEVHLKGEYLRSDWELFCCKSIYTSKDKVYMLKTLPDKSGSGQFNVKFRTKKKRIQMLFSAIGPQGEYEDEMIDITVTDAHPLPPKKSSQTSRLNIKPEVVKKKVDIHRVDELGNLMPLKVRAFSRWGWAPQKMRTKGEPLYFPFHETWIEMPRGYKILDSFDSKSLVQINPNDFPATWRSNSNRVFKIRANEFRLLINFKVLDPNNKIKKLALIVAINPVKKRALVHESCGKRGISLKSTENFFSKLPLALLCKSDGNNLGVYVFYDSSYDLSQKRYPSLAGGSLIEKRSHVTAKSSGKTNIAWKFYQFAMPFFKTKLARYMLRRSGSKRVQKFELMISKRGLASANSSYKKTRIKKTLNLSAGLALTSLNYKENKESVFSADHSALLTTVKVAGLYQLNSRWNLGANSYFNAIQISSNSSVRIVRVLGANFRIGYRLPVVSEPWALRILGGVYYTDMLVTDWKFGYRQLVFPQVMPTLSRRIGGSRVGGYFKYVPIFHRDGREIAFGLNWNLSFKKPTSRLRSINFSIDYSNLKQKESSTFEGELQTFSVGAGVGW